MVVTINNPRLSDPIGRLKYIGTYFRKRFKQAGINTLKDLRDLTQSQTRAQNTRFLRQILENPRKLECVGSSKFNSQTQKYSTYCVRRENQLAWYSVITYLERKGVPSRILPPAVQNRGNREKCAKQNKCLARSPVELLPRRYERIPYFPIEYVVVVMLNTPNKTIFTSQYIYNRVRKATSLRSISAVLASNSGTKGKRLFQTAGQDRETNKTQYKLKSSVKRTLRNKNSQQVLDYLRKL